MNFDHGKDLKLWLSTTKDRKTMRTRKITAKLPQRPETSLAENFGHHEGSKLVEKVVPCDQKMTMQM